MLNLSIVLFCRKPRRQSDVTSLISALDTTLKMSNVSVDRESPDVETAPEEDEEMEPLDVPYGEKRTPSFQLSVVVIQCIRRVRRNVGMREKFSLSSCVKFLHVLNMLPISARYLKHLLDRLAVILAACASSQPFTFQNMINQVSL